MKKIYLALTIVAGSLLSSCNMDLAPVGSLDEENAIETVTDLLKARNGIYENLRSMATGGYLYCSDIQMDQFMGLTINGNQNGIFAHGNITSSNEDIEAMWANCYAYIANANFFFGKADHVLSKPDLTEDDLLEGNRYVAETKFARAYYYAYLLDKFCNSYSTTLATEPAKGLPLTTVFNPTADNATYPGRSTMDETYKLIEQDLKDAYDGLKAYEEAAEYKVIPMSPYVNSMVVKALQTRLALLRSDWTTAVTLAKEIIDSKIYTLATTSNYANMWTNDESNEIIFRPVSTSTELGIGSTGGAYIDAAPDKAYYVPTYATYSKYDTRKDVRFKAFFATRGLTANGIQYQAYCFNKFPGNPTLNSGSTNALLNMGKPFRLSEIYLILAEAAMESGDEATANDALNTLRKNRITSYFNKNYTGTDLRQEIREERTKELLGEGFRMSDLRRWGLGFTRDASYPANPSLTEIFVTVDTQVEYIPGDHRYVWPIPNAEMESNPQLKGQQNPEYGNN